jgi:hypothetical protein
MNIYMRRGNIITFLLLRKSSNCDLLIEGDTLIEGWTISNFDKICASVHDLFAPRREDIYIFIQFLVFVRSFVRTVRT